MKDAARAGAPYVLSRRSYLLQHDDGRRHEALGLERGGPQDAELPQAPEVNMREPMLESWVWRHRQQMPDGVPWVSGALLPPGVAFTNGTWSPRAFW